MDLKVIPREEFHILIQKMDNIEKKVDTIHRANPLEDTWLDVHEVFQLLKISKRTLQNYRDNGIIPYSKIGGKIYYKASDIQHHLESHYVSINNNK